MRMRDWMAILSLLVTPLLACGGIVAAEKTDGGSAGANTGGYAGANTGGYAGGGYAGGGYAGANTGGYAGGGYAGGGYAGGGNAGGGYAGGGYAGGGYAGSSGGCTESWNGLKACDECFQSMCTAECGQCSAGSDCYAFITCANGCAGSNSGCIQSCNDAHPNGMAVVNAMSNCVDAKCASPCNDIVGDPCSECQTSKCSAEIDTCMQNSACLSINTCLGQCQNQACADACAKSYPAGTTDFNAAMTCVMDKCLTECS